MFQYASVHFTTGPKGSSYSVLNSPKGKCIFSPVPFFYSVLKYTFGLPYLLYMYMNKCSIFVSYLFRYVTPFQLTAVCDAISDEYPLLADKNAEDEKVRCIHFSIISFVIIFSKQWSK